MKPTNYNPQLIPRIAEKLYNQGLNSTNYSFAKAWDILSRTVAPRVCQAVLSENEAEIVTLIEGLTKSNKNKQS